MAAANSTDNKLLDNKLLSNKLTCATVKQLEDMTEDEFVMHLRILMAEIQVMERYSVVQGLAMSMIEMLSDTIDDIQKHNEDYANKGTYKKLIPIVVSAVDIINS